MENYRNLWLIAPFEFYLHIFLKIICRKQDSMWQNLIIVIADEVSAMIDHAMKEIPAAALLYLLYYYREISNLLFVAINGTI